MKKMMSVSAVVLLIMSGCGGGGGSTSDLATVSLSVTAVLDRLEADMVTSNTCTSGSSSGGTFSTETIPIAVTSTKYNNVTNPSPVTIQQISISYQPYNTTAALHPLPAQYDTGKTVSPGSTVQFDVKVAPDSLKILMYDNGNGFQLCSLDYWEYYALITFSGEEDYTKKKVSFSQTVKVAFADRVNN